MEKRKRGKLVTVVSGLSGSAEQNRELLTELKNQCGAGGTIAGAAIEIQGDHVQRLQAALQDRGYRVGG